MTNQRKAMPLRDKVPFVARGLLVEISKTSWSQSYRQTLKSFSSISTVGTSALCSGWRAFAVKEATTHVPTAWGRFASLDITFPSTTVLVPSLWTLPSSSLTTASSGATVSPESFRQTTSIPLRRASALTQLPSVWLW